MARQLKLFRTPIGFHDAYVAAPSRKAALQAWGTDKNLFARGVAEQVEDAELLGKLGESPGKVYRRLRGSAAEQIEALPPSPSLTGLPAPGKSGRKKRARKPRDDEVKRTKSAMATLDRAQHAERHEMAVRERALQRERRDLEERQAQEMRWARDDVDAAQAAYDSALAAWRSGGDR